MGAVLVKNAERMMTSAETSRKGIEIIFADGQRGVVPFSEIPELAGFVDLDNVELPNPYEAILHTKSGQTLELPWDFVRHYCDSTYRPRIEAVALAGRRAIGARIRQLRVSAGLTQQALSQAAGVSRVTLLRIEKGEQSPRYDTLVSLANALGGTIGEFNPVAEPPL